MQSCRRKIAGTSVWCLLMGVVRLLEMSVSGGSTVLAIFKLTICLISGRKPFRIQSPEGIAILVVAGIITGLAIMWLVNICVIKRKTFTGYHVGFTCTGEKKAEKKADELKDQLIV